MTRKTTQWSLSDLFVPGLGLLLGAYYLYTVRGLAPLTKLYGGSLSILCISFFAAAAFLVKKHNKKSFFSGSTKKIGALISKHSKFLVMAILTALFVILIPIAGYPFAGILFVATTTLYLKYSNIFGVLKVSFIVTLLGFVLFILFLNVDLPLDPLTSMIKEAFYKCGK